MRYIYDKLDTLNYYDLSKLLSFLRLRQKLFKITNINAPEYDNLAKMVFEECNKRADLIPREKLKNDLEFNYILLWSN